MVAASLNPVKVEKIRDDIELPIIDLSDRSKASKLIVKACEEYGFFKVINHGVPHQIITHIEEEARDFFSKPGPEKQRVGPANPYGYGGKNIGSMGDMGEVEYLLLQVNQHSLSQNSFSDKLRDAVSDYAAAVRELACEILDLMAEGMHSGSGGGPPPLSGLIMDAESDSVLRFNNYPPASDESSPAKIGFGEHTDPQLLTLLRSNAVDGLQISVGDGVWVPVDPYPASAFCVNVGDVLQVMTNERFLSVRHRAVVKSYMPRMSIAYFAAPPLHATICCLPGLATLEKPPLHRSFTWAEYKNAAYTKRLGDTRLDLFKMNPDYYDDLENKNP